VYIIFSRQPDFFSSEQTGGFLVDARKLSQSVVAKYKIKPGDYPIVRYNVGAIEYYFNGNGNWFFKYMTPRQKVGVIYDSTYPEKASVYRVAGYWIVISELLFLLATYGVLFGVAIAITGKHPQQNLSDVDLDKKMKYN